VNKVRGDKKKKGIEYEREKNSMIYGWKQTEEGKEDRRLFPLIFFFQSLYHFFKNTQKEDSRVK
jgi:hypothetical protein